MIGKLNHWWRQHKLRHIEMEIEYLREEIEQLHLHLNDLIAAKHRIDADVSHGAQPAWRK